MTGEKNKGVSLEQKSMIQLRDYQKDAIEALFNYFDLEDGKFPLLVAPTGSGKSLLIAEFCKRVCIDSQTRIMVVTHTKELIEQNEKELRGYWNDAPTGIYSAGLGHWNTQAQIIFAGIQSIYRNAFMFGKVGIVIIDEAHMLPRDSETRYGRFLKDMLVANPKLVVIGLTATPYRMDSGVLHEGKDALFDGIAYCCDMKRLISEGFLVPVVSKGGVMKIDLSNVHLQAGDYKPNELAHAADDVNLVKYAVSEIVDYGAHRKAWLIFAAGVEHALHVSKEVESHGITCKVVTGDTPNDERDRTVKEFREGKIRCLVNVGVFTTGFNAPVCDLIALLMATKSTGKYVQMVGRGMRTYPEKENCLLLDYGNNVVTHGAIDEVDPIKTRNIFNVEKKPAPMKECEKCHCILHARVMVCPACGFEFPVVSPHGAEAYGGAVLSNQKEPFFVDIETMFCTRYKKPGRPDILKIELCNALDKEYPIWCCLGHDGYAQEKAKAIVKTFGGHAKTVDEALKEWSYWRKPIRIKVVPNGKFFNVVGIEFAPIVPSRPEEKKRVIDETQKQLV